MLVDGGEEGEVCCRSRRILTSAPTVERDLGNGCPHSGSLYFARLKALRHHGKLAGH